MNFQIETSVSVVAVFIQGLLSFFSPCVLPLLPLYVGYLAGGTKVEREDGTITYPRGKLLLNTLFFVLGVSFTFVLLGFGFTALGRFFSSYRVWFARISGIIVILFGLYQLGVFGLIRPLTRERRLPFALDRIAMNPLTALVLGFTFSFAWTPCVGPVLTSVLLMAGSAASSWTALMLIGVYALGFTIPFIFMGLFTSAILSFFKKHQNIVRYTVKIGGVIMILMGIMLLTGWLNGVTSYLSKVTPNQTGSQPIQSEALPVSSDMVDTESAASSSETKPQKLPPASEITLTDQFGQSHSLSEYKGKTIFLNFWATWCGPCQREMPDIQSLYEKYGRNQGDLIVLGVANPKSEKYPLANDGSREEVTAFLGDNGYTYPVMMDESGEAFAQYGVTSFPTTFMIDTDGNVFGYVKGSLTADMSESIVRQTMNGERE